MMGGTMPVFADHKRALRIEGQVLERLVARRADVAAPSGPDWLVPELVWWLGTLVDDPLVHDAAAAIAALRERTGASAIATVGFCFGGTQSFMAATSAELDLDGAVGFYAGLVPRREGAPEPIVHAPETRCPVLGLFGGADENILPEHIEAYERGLREAGVEHEIVTYPGAPHSFFDRSFSEHAEACEDAWRRVLGFLEQVGASLAR